MVRSGSESSDRQTARVPAVDSSAPSRPTTTEPHAATKFYGRWARLYDLLATWLPGVRDVRRSVAAACGLSAGDTVVELGCGTGSNLGYLSERVGDEGRVIGVDITPEVLALAADRTKDLENVSVVRGDATRPPLDTTEPDIDAVVATFLVGMLPDPAAAVSTWCDLVGPGGRIVLANATTTDHWSAPLLNRAFRAFVVCSTPPTTQVRYDGNLVAQLETRVSTAHERLHDESRATVDSRHAMGLVRLTGGIVGEPGG
nr:methyltransferase domain-containing protein [Halovivax asiaticus]